MEFRNFSHDKDHSRKQRGGNRNIRNSLQFKPEPDGGAESGGL